MRTLSPASQAHLAGSAVSLATCWRVTRRDGQVFCFTDHDRDLVIGAETFLSTTGFVRSAMAADASLAVDDTELLGVLDAATVTDADLRNGLWDYAEVRLWIVNWQAPTDGEMAVRRGWLGEVTTDDDGRFRVEFRGLTQPLQQRVGEVYSAECRADLFDARCKLNVADWTVSAVVESAPTRGRLIVPAGALAQETGWFDGGVATFTTGLNAGVAREVVAWDAAARAVDVFPAFPQAVALGDAFTIWPGCDKRRETCQTKFSNYLNFRGEPFVPGTDAQMEVGGR